MHEIARAYKNATQYSMRFHTLLQAMLTYHFPFDYNVKIQVYFDCTELIAQ